MRNTLGRTRAKMDTLIMYNKGSRDPRLVTVRRGGTLRDADHRLLAVWAAACAEHVLHLFEQAHPGDERPRRAIEQARAWARGEITMTQARTAAYAAHDAAREASGSAKEAARAAGLVDEYQLFVVPVVVGGGTRCLPHGIRLNLQLVDQRPFDNGTVYLSYRPVG